MQSLRRAGLVAAFGLLAMGPAIDVADAVPLASHRASYELSLDRSDATSGVTQVRGRLVVEWQDSCDGFATNQRFYTEFSSEVGAVVNDFWLSSWEARDGSRFRFSLTSSVNGRVDERVQGQAAAGRGEVGGNVTFDLPAGTHMDLPPGTLFPTGHTEALIAAAQSGKRHLERLIFDGSPEDGLVFASAFIGPAIPANGRLDGKPSPVGADLMTARAWPVRLAFFGPDKVDGLPEYEFAFRLYENGVATGLVLDYGDLIVNGELTEIEALPGGCDRP